MKYNDKVRVTGGFFGGQTGTLHSHKRTTMGTYFGNEYGVVNSYLVITDGVNRMMTDYIDEKDLVLILQNNEQD